MIQKPHNNPQKSVIIPLKKKNNVSTHKSLQFSGRELGSHRLQGILESSANIHGTPTTTWGTWTTLGKRMGEAFEQEQKGFNQQQE